MDKDKTILIIRRTKYGSCKANYHVEKDAKTLERASEYLVSLRNLNDEKEVSYELFNAFGQFEVDTIEKVEDKKEVVDEITF